MRFFHIVCTLLGFCLLISACGKQPACPKEAASEIKIKNNKINVIIPEYSTTKSDLPRELIEPSLKVGDEVRVYIKEMEESFLFYVTECNGSASVIERPDFELREDASYMLVYPDTGTDSWNCVNGGFGIYSHTFDHFITGFRSVDPNIVYTDTLSIADARKYGYDPQALVDTMFVSNPDCLGVPAIDTLLLLYPRPVLSLESARDDVGMNIEFHRWNGIVTLDIVSPFDGNVAEISIYDPSDYSFCMKGAFQPVGTTMIPRATTWFNYWFFPIYEKALEKGETYSYLTTIFPLNYSDKDLTLFIRMEDGRIARVPVSLPDIQQGQLVSLSFDEFEICDDSYVMPDIIIAEKIDEQLLGEPIVEKERRPWCFDNWDI